MQRNYFKQRLSKSPKNKISITQTLTAQKLKFFIKHFLSKCDQICKKLQIWSHIRKTSFFVR